MVQFKNEISDKALTYWHRFPRSNFQTSVDQGTRTCVTKSHLEKYTNSLWGSDISSVDLNLTTYHDM